MPKTLPPKDRFDDLVAETGRIGAHRAENPRLRGSVILLWSAIATVVLVALGVFGTMLATGRITFAPTPEATVTIAPTADPVVDTAFKVTILNATAQDGLAGAMSDTLVAAGWAADDVTAGAAGSQDFPTTTVFYSSTSDEGAARGLAEVIRGAAIELSDAYADLWGDESVQQLVIVIGLDSTEAGAETPAS